MELAWQLPRRAWRAGLGRLALHGAGPRPDRLLRRRLAATAAEPRRADPLRRALRPAATGPALTRKRTRDQTHQRPSASWLGRSHPEPGAAQPPPWQPSRVPLRPSRPYSVRLRLPPRRGMRPRRPGMWRGPADQLPWLAGLGLRARP